MEIEGQLNAAERRLITEAIVGAARNWKSQLHDVSENGLFHARKIADKPSPQSLRAAKRHLFRQACHPAEIAASYLPASVCAFALRLLPGKFSRQLTDGEN